MNFKNGFWVSSSSSSSSEFMGYGYCVKIGKNCIENLLNY